MYYLVFQFILFYFLIFYSFSDDSEEEECPDEYTPIVYEDAYNGVIFPPCYGDGFFPPKHIQIEIETDKTNGFLITLYGYDEFRNTVGYFYIIFSNFGLIRLSPKFASFEFETGNNLTLDFYSLEDNVIKIVITNPDESFFEYNYTSTKEDLGNISMIKYGGEPKLPKLKKVTLY